MRIYFLLVWAVTINEQEHYSSPIGEPCETSVLVLNNPYVEELCRELLDRLDQNEISYETFKERFEIDPNNLKTNENEDLGSGNFGYVKKGTLVRNGNELTVAVKRLTNPNKPNEQYLFIAELTVMCAIEKHPNILALVGGITFPPYKIVLEYVERGCLLDRIKECKSDFNDMIIWEETDNGRRKTENYNRVDLNANPEIISTFDLISFAYQIANGMNYLTSIPCVHRDLALRNILLADDKTIRIGDFGLARRRNKGYYESQNKENDTFPILWTAPEADENLKFTEKSDVWSFGICLYELFTLGAKPTIDGVSLSKSNEIFPEPDMCPTRIYKHMKVCWERNPYDRPKFAWSVEILEGHLRRFSEIAYKEVEQKLKKVTKSREKW